MKARSFLAALFAGIVVVGIVTVGRPLSAKAGPVGFAAGGNAAAAYPVGSATGPNPATVANGSTTLGIGIPFQTQTIDNYMYAGSCPWIQPALAAEGYSIGNGANQWKITYQPLKGNDISLNTYAPWINSEPAITQGNLTVAASA